MTLNLSILLYSNVIQEVLIIINRRQASWWYRHTYKGQQFWPDRLTLMTCILIKLTWLIILCVMLVKHLFLPLKFTKAETACHFSLITQQETCLIFKLKGQIAGSSLSQYSNNTSHFVTLLNLLSSIKVSKYYWSCWPIDDMDV